MTQRSQLGRGRPWWRSRRAMATVALVDLVGGIALVSALSHHGGRHHPGRRAVATATVTRTVIDAPTAHVTRPHRRHRQIAPRRHHEPHVGPTVPSPAVADAGFARLAAAEPGSIGLAIAPLGAGRVRTFGSLQVDDAWSTMKVPVVTTVLRDVEAAGQRLSPVASRDATLALEQSDNDAVNALFSALETRDGGLDGASADLQRTLAAGGDRTTHVNTVPNDQGFSTFGQTQWPAAGEVAVYRRLARGCLLTDGDTRWVLGLMAHVEPDQRWGAGAAGFAAGTPLMFKGGWGPEQGGDYLVRQTAIVGSGDRGWVFSMLARPSDGSFVTGTGILSRLATWVAQTFPADRVSPPRACR